MALPTLKTYIAPTTRSLLRYLSQSLTIPSNSVNLFALSARADDLEDAVAYLTGLPNSVGALNASPYKGVQVAIASYPSTSCLPFRSTIPGVPHAEVGRIRTYRPPTRGDEASETRLNQALSGGNVNWNDALVESGSLELPPDLQHIRNNSDISSFLYLSDNAPEGLLNSLHRHFPSASQLGIIGSSTPFITGRPFTLFKGSNVFSDGAVGLALLDQKSHHTSIFFEDVRPVSAAMEVTQVQTNMVEKLDNSNPAERLLLAMKSSNTMDKELDIYLGVLDPSVPAPVNGSLLHAYSRMYKIAAGSPSQGSILLDATEGPQVGARVQFAFVEPSKETLSHLHSFDPTVPTVASSIIPDSEINLASAEPDIRETTNIFLGISEHGFVSSHGQSVSAKRPWKCAVPGATCSLQWSRRGAPK